MVSRLACHLLTDISWFVYLFIYLGPINNRLLKCGAGKEQKDKHPYEYVDENVIENIRKKFQESTVHNKTYPLKKEREGEYVV